MDVWMDGRMNGREGESPEFAAKMERKRERETRAVDGRLESWI